MDSKAVEVAKLGAYFEAAVDSFPWESQEQREGFLNFVQYKMKFGIKPEPPVDILAAYFIQKDHESNEYWREMVGGQVTALQAEIMNLKSELAHTQQRTEDLLTGLKSQTAIIETLASLLKKA